jgi:hypothetical protein
MRNHRMSSLGYDLLMLTHAQRRELLTVEGMLSAIGLAVGDRPGRDHEDDQCDGERNKRSREPSHESPLSS